MKFKKVRSAILAATLACSMCVTPVFAEPNTDTSSLQSQKAAAQSEADTLQSQLNTLMTKQNELEIDLGTKGLEVEQAKIDLAEAEAKKQKQYEDMKLRIKYMYEEGNNSAMERIAESGSIAEVLTQSEYVEKIHGYDRNMLQEYADTVEEVENLTTSLEEEYSNLQNLESEYKAQSQELSSTIESKRAEVTNLDAMIQEAARIATKAAEEKAAKLAAEQQAAAQQVIQQQQQAADTQTGGTDTSGQNTPSADVPVVDNNTQNSGTDTVVPDTPSADTPVVDTTPAPSEPTYNAGTGNAVVDRAYSQLGAEYVWGACSPGQFDCSGFVSYCLTGSYTRLGTTYTFLGWPQVSDPQPGDVCVSAEHCGIYIGNGQMIHAATEGVGVIIGSVQSGMIYVRY